MGGTHPTFERRVVKQALRCVAALVLLCIPLAGSGGLSGCGGGEPIAAGAASSSSVHGFVVKGPVSGGTVTAYALDAQLERGRTLGVATTDPTGAFELEMGTYNGPVLLVASTGSYTDEASGVTVQLNGNELTALLPEHETGATVQGVRLTPISTLATAFATYRVTQRGAQLTQALDEAFVHLNAHFGDIDWRTTPHADLTVPGITTLSPEAKVGLALAALSQLALTMSEANGLTAGTSINAGSITSTLVLDILHDGALDGIGPSGTLTQSRSTLSGATLRRSLSQAVAAFVASARNKSTLRDADVRSFQAALANGADPYLFCPGGILMDRCAGGGDIDKPTVTFHGPVEGSGVSAGARVQVRAEDASAIRNFAFTAPASLMAAEARFENGGRLAILEANLDVSALPDGPLVISTRAVDAWDNAAESSITVHVANSGPTISIAAPALEATVRGSTTVSATAAGHGGRHIAKLKLRDAVPGMGVDLLNPSDAFAATWDTTRVPEGPFTLTFHAEDSHGATSDLSVTVLVDNRPSGKVTATVHAGAPVQGATLRLVAIDAITGLPVTDRPAGPVLGTSPGVTNVDGTITFELLQENYEGPVQLQASGQAVTFIDPSDGTTQVTVDSSFSFTSLIRSYRTGDTLERPVTLLTTLTDAVALTLIQGRNPSAEASLAKNSIVEALTQSNSLLAAHFLRPQRWALRKVHPASLTTGPEAMREGVWAALNDLALNRLARDIALETGQTPGRAYSAVQLTRQLIQDFSADGLFDGRAGTVQLSSGSSGTNRPYRLDANTLRFRQSIALERFLRSPQNRSGLSRGDFEALSVYDNIALDSSYLFPADQQPVPFDSQPPVVTFTVGFVGKDGSTFDAPVGDAKYVAGTTIIRASAHDSAGVSSLRVQVGSAAVPALQGSSSALFVGAWDSTTAADGTLTFTAYAEDGLGNTGTTAFTVSVDNTAPAITATKPLAGFYSTTVDVDATANDTGSGLASFALPSWAGFTDNDSAEGRIFGTWAIPSNQADGPADFTPQACDRVGNCTGAAISRVTVDRTPPALSFIQQPASPTTSPSVTFRVKAEDGGGAGPLAIFGVVGSEAPISCAPENGVCSLTFNLTSDGTYSFRFWGMDKASPANSGELLEAAPHLLGVSVVRDTAGPRINELVVTFLDDTNTPRSAKALGNRVANTTTVSVTASDDTGMASLVVRLADGTPLTLKESTPTNYIGTFDTLSVPDGALSFVATAKDMLGNTSTRAANTTVDNTAPSITVVRPSEGYFSRSLPVEATAEDAGPLDAFSISGLEEFSDTDGVLTRILGSWTIPLHLADGPLPVSLRACDVLHNCTMRTVTPKVDRTPPEVTLVQPPPTMTRGSSVTVTLRGEDRTGAGTALLLGSLNRGAPLSCTPVNGECSIAFALEEDGTHEFRFWAADLAAPANTGDGWVAPYMRTATVVRDTVPPVIDDLLASFITDKQTTMMAIDAERRLANLATLQGTASDNSAGMLSVLVTLADGAPLTTVGESASRYTGTFDTSKVPDGALSFRVTATDLLGNGTSRDFTYTVDNTRPVVSVPHPVAGYYAAFLQVEATASDGSSLTSFTLTGLEGFADEDGVLARILGTWSIPASQPEGSLPLVFEACDVAYNCATHTRAVHVDRLAPEVTVLSAPAAMVKASSATFTLRADDRGGSGVHQIVGVVTRSATGGNSTVGCAPNTAGECSMTFPLPEDDEYTFSFWAWDRAGPANSGQGKQAPYLRTVILSRDTAGPRIADLRASFVPDNASTPVDSASIGNLLANEATLSASANDRPAGMQSVVVRTAAGNGLNGPVSSPSGFEGTYDTAKLADGTLTFVVTATDTLGNTSTREFTYTVDNTQPAIAIIKPASGYYSTAVEVDASASDASQLASFTYSGLTGFSPTVATADRIVGTWSTSGQTDGARMLSLHACDRAGNCRSNSRSVTVDRTPPEVAVQTAPSTHTTASSVTFTLRGNDRAGAGVSRLYGTMDGGATTSCVPDEMGACSLSFALTEGPHTFRFWGVDKASPSNDGASESGAPYVAFGNVTRDTRAPAIGNLQATFMTDAGNARTADSSGTGRVANLVTFEVSASDGSSGMRSVTVMTSHGSLKTTSSSANSYKGTLDTSTIAPETSVTFTVTATDNLGTTSTASVMYVVDNTAPTVTFASPSSGAFYGGSVEVEVTARDGAGVSSFTHSGLPGFYPTLFTTADAKRIKGSWSTSGQADGPKMLSTKACDALDNCTADTDASAKVTFKVDTTAPRATFAQAPPQYTKESSITLNIFAADDGGSGVTAVYVLNGGAAEVLAEPKNNGVWTASILPFANSTNRIYIWAVDKTGNGSKPPAANAEVIHDRKSESLQQHQQASYRSEENLFIAYSSPGVPQTPAEYNVSTLGAKIALTDKSQIHKLHTRAGGATGGDSAKELIEANAANTPFLVYKVPVPAATAPIETAEVSVAMACADCPEEPARYSMLYWKRDASANEEYYIAPIHAGVLPHLAFTTEASVGLSVVANVVDKAGNASPAMALNLTYHLKGPELGVWQHGLYADSKNSAPDAKSPYAYKVSDLSYASLWSSANATLPPEQPARVARYIIRNPYTMPLVVTLNPTGDQSWSFVESWVSADYTVPANGSHCYQLDGECLPYNRAFETSETNAQCGGTNYPPCAGRPAHRKGAVGVIDTCDYKGVTAFQAANGDSWSTVAFAPTADFDYRTETTAAKAGPTLVSGRASYVVPAAQGTIPGSIVVYVAIPHIRGSGPALKNNATSGTTAETLPDRFQYHWGDRWTYFSRGNVACSDPDLRIAYYYDNYRARRVIEYLAKTRFSINTPVELRASATRGSDQALAGPQRANEAPAVTVTRDL